MKTKLTLTVAALLLATMLLINLVLFVFWKRDALQREAAQDQAALIHIAYRAAVEKARPQAFFFAEFYPGAQTGEIVVLLRDEARAGLPPLLAEAAAESMRTGQAVVHSTAWAAELLRGRAPFIASALPLRQDGRIIGVVAVIRPLESVFHALWQAERIVLIYIAVNLLALAALFFFRLNSLVVRPAERLVELARRHSGSEAVWFAAEDSGSEFNRLASSLNSMLARIEHDRHILRTTVAELETVNRQLHERQEELIRAEKLAAAGRLAAGLAHEIGNPLAVIQGYLGLLERGGQSADNQDFIRRAAQELERVTRLVRQLLDCARSSKGRPEDVSLHELMEAAADMVRVQKAFRQIKLTVQAGAAQDRVHADPDQLRQVLLNCLLNSADAVGSAGRTDGVITLTTDLPEPGLLRLRIEDNGIGIAAEQLGAVFDPFFTTKEPGRGTGLGLSVSRSIVEAAGGSMKMASRAGQGSTVSICLPLAFC
ncbi:sensor histidine kinase [Candidatus Electronema sp. JM]|uniref:sensor histidine kinase n=1 Tax=Candidatus Electronema sp. JM TaxID=3401571 RepID=UPI003AA935A8